MGVHKLAVEREGFSTFSEDVPVRFEKTTQVVVHQSAMSKTAQRAERRRRAAAETPIYSKWWFWSAMAVSAIATGIAVGYGVPKQAVVDCARGGCP
jgi:hypothetical protein